MGSLPILATSLAPQLCMVLFPFDRNSDPPSSADATSIAETALDRVISINSLFTLAIFVGLSLASPGQKSLSNRPSCQPSGSNITVEHLVIFEVLAFGFFLFSSLVAQAIKLWLKLLNTDQLSTYFSINVKVLQAGMMMTAVSSVMGCLFLMVSMLSVVEIKTGLLFCGAKSTIISVSFLTILTSSGLISTTLYTYSAMYTFTPRRRLCRYLLPAEVWHKATIIPSKAAKHYLFIFSLFCKNFLSLIWSSGIIEVGACEKLSPCRQPCHRGVPNKWPVEVCIDMVFQQLSHTEFSKESRRSLFVKIWSKNKIPLNDHVR